MRRRRLIIALAVLLALAAVTTLLWEVLDWPPPRLILRYGLTPGCEPTGQTKVLEGVEFVQIGPGCFRMGSTYHAKGGDLLGKFCAVVGLPWGDQPEPSREMPVHWVEFPRGFWIAKYELTNEQYDVFDPEHERSEHSPGDRHPVVDVSWEDAQGYCAWLSERSGMAIRLPSESEWECACRAGSHSEYCFGDDEVELKRFAWFGMRDGVAREVGQKSPSLWGLHDMHGNVLEWCEDAVHGTYANAPSDGSAWVGERERGFPRAIRGGCWISRAAGCRAATRHWQARRGRGFRLGFRPVFIDPND